VSEAGVSEVDALEVLDEEPESWSPVDGALEGAGVEAEPEFPPDRIAAMTALLQPSETSSLCCLRQARTRPPPGCTPAQSFCTSEAHAVRGSEAAFADEVCGRSKDSARTARMHTINNILDLDIMTSTRTNSAT
jgi:hypothetical protein